MNRLVYIISDINKSLSLEWTLTHLKDNYELSVILIGRTESALTVFLTEKSIRYFAIDDNRHWSGFSKFIKLLSILQSIKPTIIHCHLWRASLLGLPAGWLLRIKKRIFTRHHAAIHYDEFPRGRKWDRLCNFLATDIVAISQNVDHILTRWDNTMPKKVHIIHHGFDLKYFDNVSNDRVYQLKHKYEIKPTFKPIIGAISRYLELKGIQYLIPAFKDILDNYPGAHLILANAYGPYENEVKTLLRQLPQHTYTEISFEADLAALYKLFDVFVHIPITQHSEAFGQTYVEALAAGVPSIFTLSGVAPEFVEDGKNAVVVDFKDSAQVTEAITKLLASAAFRQTLVQNGKKSVQQFSLHQMLSKLNQLYEG